MIKSGDIVRVNVKLTAVAVGHDVKCNYQRLDGSTRPVYIPAECLEVVAVQPVENTAGLIICTPEGIYEGDKLISKAIAPDDYQTHVDLAAGHDGTVTAYKCGVCGKVCKAAIGLSGHMRSHQS